MHKISEYLSYQQAINALKLPPQKPLPAKGHYPVVKTDDGGLYFSKAIDTHYQLIQKQKIPPERVVGGGWMTDGVYNEHTRSDSEKIGERARASLRVKLRRQQRKEK